jgi:hypothetical protein
MTLRCLQLAALFVVVALTSGCDRVTGGGRLDGVNGTASFGFNADGCNFPEFKGEFQYVDNDRNVKFHGDVVFARQCIAVEDCPTCDALRTALGFPLTFADYEIQLAYRSQAGDGTARVCVTDNGEGANSTGSDTAIVVVETGPYAGYLNYGSARGNIQQHRCTGN